MDAVSYTHLDVYKRQNLYHIVTDLERIGDHAENVLGYALQMKEDKRKFSDKALKNLKELSQAVYKIYDLACEHFSNPSEELYRVIYDLEADIDKMVDKMRASNSKRLSKMKCEAVQGLSLIHIWQFLSL